MDRIGSPSQLPVGPTHEPSSKKKNPRNDEHSGIPLAPGEAAGKHAPGAKSTAKKYYQKLGLSKKEKGESATKPSTTKKPDEVRDSGSGGSSTEPFYFVPYNEHRAGVSSRLPLDDNAVEKKLSPFDPEQERADLNSATPEPFMPSPMSPKAKTVPLPQTFEAQPIPPASPPDVFASTVQPRQRAHPFPEITGSRARAFNASRRDGSNTEEPLVSPINEGPPDLPQFSSSDRYRPQDREYEHYDDDYDDDASEAPSRAAPAQQNPQPRPLTAVDNVMDAFDQMSPEDQRAFVQHAQAAQQAHPEAAGQPLTPQNPFMSQLMQSMQGQAGMTEMNLALMQAASWQGWALQQASTSNSSMLNGNMLAGLELHEAYDNSKRLI